MYLGVMVLICAPLSSWAMQLSPIYPHSSYVFDSMPMSEGVWIQDWSLFDGFMP